MSLSVFSIEDNELSNQPAHLTRPRSGYPTSQNVTRLIKRLIDATEPKALTIGQLSGLSNAINTVQHSDPAVLQTISKLDDYQHQLTDTQAKKRFARLGATPGQLDIEGNELTA